MGCGKRAGGPCTYPTEGFGLESGDVVPRLTWQGYAEGAQKPATIDIASFQDCDGTKGIHAILVDTSALWCGPCQQAAKRIHDELAGEWAGLGIHVITLIAQDSLENPASIDSARVWRDEFGLTDTTVAADPLFSLVPPEEMVIGLPVEHVVDPRTMTIVDIQEGFSGDYSSIVDLARDNRP